MKKVVASLCACTLAFSLFGMPAAAYAEQRGEAPSSEAALVAGTLPEDAMGPVKVEASGQGEDMEDAEGAALKDPVFNEESDDVEGMTPSQPPKDEPSLLDNIVSFFTGGSESDATRDEAGQTSVEIDKSRAISGGSLEVLFHTSLPTVLGAKESPLVLRVGGKTAEFKAQGSSSVLYSAVVSGIAAGSQDVSVTGEGYLPLSCTVEVKDGMKHSFHVMDAVTETSASYAEDAAVMPYGDFDGNGHLDDADARVVSEAYVQGSADLAYDLASDGRITLKDAQMAAISKGCTAKAPQRISETPDSTQTDPEVPEGTSVLLDGEVVTGAAALDAVAGLTQGKGQTVGLMAAANVVRPAEERVPVSETLPVKLHLGANGALIDSIVLQAPVESGAGVSMPLEGSIALSFETDAGDQRMEVFYRAGSSPSGPAPTPEYPTPESIDIDTQRGTVTVVFPWKLKVFDMDFTFTKASEPDASLIQLTSITYPSKEEPPDLPAAVPGKPGQPEITTDDHKVSLAWEALEHAEEYEVEIAASPEVRETKKVTATSITFTELNGQPLENGLTYSLRLRGINEDNVAGDWSDYVYGVPERKTPPDNPKAPELKAGYREITATWDPVERADSYVLHYARANAEDFATVETTGTEYTVTGLDVQVEYVFYVVAVNQFGSSDETGGIPPRSRATTTYVSTKVPWYSLINRAVQDRDANLPGDVFSSCKANGSVEEGAKVVDGDYNTYYQVPAGTPAALSNGVTATFKNPQSLREFAITTNLGKGYADDIEDVFIDVNSGLRTTRYTKGNGLTWDVAPTRDGSSAYAENTVMVRLPVLETGVNAVTINFVRKDDAPTTISELAFYKGTNIHERIAGLFKADSMGTELVDGVDEATISALRELLHAEDPDSLTPPNETAERYWATSDLDAQLDCALALVKDKDVRVVRTHPEIHGTSAEAEVLGTNAWQPTGVVAPAGAQLHVYVTPTEGMDDAAIGQATKLNLIATQNHGTRRSNMQALGPLKLGLNSIVMPTIGEGDTERGGGLYVAYDEAGCPAYDVKVIGGQTIPMLDVYGASERDLLTRADAYATEVQAYASQLAADHHDASHGVDAYIERECIANATEILTDKALVSVPATLIVQGFKDAEADSVMPRDPAGSLRSGIAFTDRMIAILYQQVGLFDVTDADSATAVSGYGANNALPTTHISFRYMYAGNGAVESSFIGLGWAEMAGVITRPSISVSADGKFNYGTLYDWNFSSFVGKAAAGNEGLLPERVADYYTQMVTSKDNDANGSHQFNYDDVTAYLNANTKGKTIDQLPNNLGIAVLWQLHLAFDEAYSYALFPDANGVMEGSLFARMNAYVRNENARPAGLSLEGASPDDALIRLACAASQRNLLSFFDAWGIPSDAATRAYAETFSPVSGIQYLTDENRGRSMSTARADVQQVAATALAKEGDEGTVQVTGIALKEGEREAGNLGFEVLRQVGTDAETRQVIGFVPAGEDTFTDRLTSDNGQTLKYYVRAVDTALNRSDVTEAGEVQADFPRNLNKAYWTVTSTMESEEDPSVMVDGSTATVYEGARPPKIAGTLGGAVSDSTSYASVTIDFNKPTDACGIRYFPGPEGAGTFKRLWVQVSDDGVNWRSVGYKEVDDATFATSKCTTVYFTKSMVMPNAPGEGSQISVQNASYLRVTDLDTSADTPISIAEIDVIGSLPDAIAIDGDNDGAAGMGLLQEEVTLKAAADGIHEGAETVIPAGSLVVGGTYSGNPSKSTILLRDALGNGISGQATQVILAERDLGSNASYSATGAWLMYFEPGTWEEAVGEWSFVSASLYRSVAAGEDEGAVLTASCPAERIPFDRFGDVAVTSFDLGKWM